MNKRLIIVFAIILKVGLEECQLRMHVDRVENILCDSYFFEFAYDPTCNYYERGNMVVEIFMIINYLSLC